MEFASPKQSKYMVFMVSFLLVGHLALANSCLSNLNKKSENDPASVEPPATRVVALSEAQKHQLADIQVLIRASDQYIHRNEPLRNTEVLQSIDFMKKAFRHFGRDLSRIPKYPEEPSVTSLVESGVSLEQAMQDLHLDPTFQPFFNTNGEFTYQPSHGPLMAENGDAAISVLQMSFASQTGAPLKDAVLVFNDLVNALKKHKSLRLSVAANDGDVFFVEQMIRPLPNALKKRIEVVKSEKKIYLWARDGAKALANQEGSLIQYAGVEVKRSEYTDFSRSQVKHHNLKSFTSLFRFEGGDILVGATHVFVGPKIVEVAMREFALSWDEAVRALGQEYGKPVIPIYSQHNPEAPVPIKFHIDLLMSVLRSQTRSDRREVVFLESPFKLLEILTGVKFKTNDSNLVYLEVLRKAFENAKTKIIEGGVVTDSEMNLYNLLFETRFENLLEQELDSQFAARLLFHKGYLIEKLPGLSSVAKSEERHFNWTNIVALDHKHILVPELDIPVLDQNVQAVYHAHGYTVYPSHSSLSTFHSSGGIRCVTNCF